MKCFDTILVFFVALIAISTVDSANNCCNESVFYRHGDKCRDGNSIALPNCAGYLDTLNNDHDFMTSYIIRNDSMGEYLDDFMGKFIVLSPNFCLAEKRRFGKVTPIAVICTSDRINYNALKIQIDESDNHDFYISYVEIVLIVSSFLSMLLLAVAFYIYYLVIPTRQLEDTCLLHFAACSSLSYAAYLYNYFKSLGLLPDMCITHLYIFYFFTLSRCSWYTLFMYYVWKKFKSGLLLDDGAVKRNFRLMGYGGPAFVITLANLHAHSAKLYTDFKFETACVAHEVLISVIYIKGPVLLAIGLNCYFWRDLTKLIKTAAISTIEDENNQKKIRSLLTLNQRLFFLFGLPWLLFIFFYGVAYALESHILYMGMIYLDYIANIFGIFIPAILVMSRARVWSCVTFTYKNVPLFQKWKPTDEEETYIVQSDNGNINVSKKSPLPV